MLLDGMRTKVITAPSAQEGEEICLSYMTEAAGEVLIDLSNLISSDRESHFAFDTDEEMFLASIQDDRDYVLDYIDTKCRLQKSDEEFTQREYLTEIRK